MRELGDASQAEHETIVNRLLSCPDIEAVLVGPEFAFAADNASLQWFPDADAAVAHFAAHPLSGATILLKGSNGEQMWKLEPIL